jgi:hypothetical protein
VSVPLLDVGEMAQPSARRRAPHDHTAAFTGRFASRQHRSLARPVRNAAMFGISMAEPCVLQTGCRVPWGAKEPRTTRPKEDTMTADALKKITTDALDARDCKFRSAPPYQEGTGWTTARISVAVRRMRSRDPSSVSLLPEYNWM